MSKQYTVNTGNYSFLSPGPASVEEYDAQAGPGACLDDAVQNVIYRGHIGEFWDKFIPKVEAAFGVKRAVDEAATERARAKAKDPKNVKDVYEKPLTFDERVRAQIGDDKDLLASLDALAKEVGASITIDVSEKQRSSGPGATYLARADQVLARTPDAIETAVTNLLTEVPNFDVQRDETGKPDRISLGHLIRQFTEKRLAAI